MLGSDELMGGLEKMERNGIIACVVISLIVSLIVIFALFFLYKYVIKPKPDTMANGSRCCSKPSFIKMRTLEREFGPNDFCCDGCPNNYNGVCCNNKDGKNGYEMAASGLENVEGFTSDSYTHPSADQGCCCIKPYSQPCEGAYLGGEAGKMNMVYNP